MLRLIVRLRNLVEKISYEVLELCCFEWFQNLALSGIKKLGVLELCCFEWFQNYCRHWERWLLVLELCCFEWFQNRPTNGT